LRLHSRAVDAFTVVLLGSLAALVGWVWFLGRYFPGTGLDQLGLRSAREITEDREEMEADDLTQMLAAHNERRRRRGKPEVSVGDIELQVAQDFTEVRRRRDTYLADRELDQLLDATNARRRARGQPERTREEVQREFGGAPAAGGEQGAGGGPAAGS